MSDLPNYDELPRTTEGAPSVWGLFGDGDNVGLFNLITPEIVRGAVGLVRRGAVFPLDAAVDAFDPAFFAGLRGAPRHRVLRLGDSGFDDVLDNYYPQTSSQWDALAHVGDGAGAFYNGVTPAQIAAGERNTIDHWARRGIVGRAVLLDVAVALADDGRAYDPSTAVGFEAEDLELARVRAGVELHPGDIVLLHTGYVDWYLAQPQAGRASIPMNLQAPGLAQSEGVCRYLWDHHVSAIACDSVGLDRWPPNGEGPFRFLHHILIGQFGMAIGELWNLGPLAADCEVDGVHEMLLVASPLNVPGGIGSPANAIAVK